MNCRNASLDLVEVSEALQRARKRAGKLPLYRYHILKIKALAPKGKRQVGDLLEPGASVAVHWVRGHFKEYTPEAPLFGRFIGLWWWQPHLAGRAARFVAKEYCVDA